MLWIDRELIFTARRLINGANVHRVNTLIFQYQQAVSLHNQSHPKFQAYPEKFERELRIFVDSSDSKRLML